MNLEQLRAITVSQLVTPSRQMLSALQTRRPGKQKPQAPQNREARRAAKRDRSPFSAMGQLYAGTVTAEEVEKRRAANRVARKSRAVNRKASK
jgi:hypothetical protein